MRNVVILKRGNRDSLVRFYGYRLSASLGTLIVRSSSTRHYQLFAAEGGIVVQKWLLPTIGEVLAQSEQTGAEGVARTANHTAVRSNHGRGRANSRTARERVRAEREWCGAIAALEQLLLAAVDASEHKQATQGAYAQASEVLGLVLAGPSPVLSHPALTASFQTRIFTVEKFNPLALMPFHLPSAISGQAEQAPHYASQLPLLPADPLAAEQFCVVLTPNFSLVMGLGEDLSGDSAFLFSFDPEVVKAAWASLRSRLLLNCPHFHLRHLDALIKQFPPTTPDYQIVMQFSRQMLRCMPSVEWESERATESDLEKIIELKSKSTPTSSVSPTVRGERVSLSAVVSDAAPVRSPRHLLRDTKSITAPQEFAEPSVESNGVSTNPKSDDVELLQAFAHEVRTPLTTIRTLTRLLLKRHDLAPDVIKRLEIIDHECTEQINRMELIFRAVELETSEVKHWLGKLTATSVDHLLQQCIPRWQKQASRRNLTLDVILPKKLPAVVSNPAMLDQVLTGLIENFARSLPAGGHIQVEVTPAGNQLKLQLLSQPDPEKADDGHFACHSGIGKGVKSIGQMLMFQPETGNLSLNLNVTKNLFQALGGKLIVRQRPQQGEVLTIFLPLEVSNNGVWKA